MPRSRNGSNSLTIVKVEVGRPRRLPPAWVAISGLSAALGLWGMALEPRGRDMRLPARCLPPVWGLFSHLTGGPAALER